MKKTIILVCVIFLFSGCQKKISENNITSQITEKVMLEKGIINEQKDNDMVEKNVQDRENTKEEKQAQNMENTKEEKQAQDNKIKTESNILKEDMLNDKNEIIVEDGNQVDVDNEDYKIHKGKIDCLEIDECMNLSLPIQFELKKSIDNVFYLEVKAKNNKTLGYFINYYFKDYQYENYETCVKKGDYLKEKMINSVYNYKCTENGLLSIYADLDGEVSD